MKNLFIWCQKRLNPGVLGVCVCLVFVSFKAAALDPRQSIYQYSCQSWNRHNGLHANNVYAITQTKDGYLWLGTSVGLLRFDGVDFSIVGAPPLSEIRNTRIACLYPARDGGLWFALERSSYGYFDGVKGWVMGMNPSGDMGWDVQSLIETPDKTLWLGGQYSSKTVSGTTNLQLLFDDPVTAPFVSAVLQDSKGRVWLGTSARGLYYWQDGKMKKLPDPQNESRLIHALAEDRAGRIWVGTESGLLCYETNSQRVRIAFPGIEIQCLLVDHRGVLWGGTSGDGIFQYKEDFFTSLRKPDGLASDFILSLAEDQEGSLWIGTRDGISQLTDVKFPTYSSQDGIPADNAVLSVSASPKGGLWVSTKGGAIYFQDDRTVLYSTNAGLSNPYVKRVFEARNGDVFVLSGANKIEVLSGGRLVASHATPKMPVAMMEDSKGVIVSIGSDLYRVSRNSLVPYEFKNGLQPELYWVVNLARGRDDSIWVASVNGICRVKDGLFQQWTKKDGLGDVNTHWVCEEPDGTVWVGMATGLARMRDGHIHNVLRKDGLLDANINAVVPDEYRNLWVYTLRGLFLLNKRNVDDFFRGIEDHVQCKSYEGPEGYGQEASACRTDDGRIWFPACKGVLCVNPTNVAVNRIVPPVRVQRVRSGGIDLDRSKPLVLQPDQQELEFSYAALSFASPQDVRFRYKLEGLDRDWIEARDRRMAYYANLQPGRYTFRVTACNSDGIWNMNGDAVEFQLLPHFYQTGWFITLMAVLAVLALLGIYGWRVRRLRWKQRLLQAAHDLLETKVTERTTELARSNTSLKNEIEERKRMGLEVERIHRQLVDASRLAGQAEVASSVLHNVGNVLNSVNISTTLISERMQKMRLSNLAKAVQLIQDHAGDLGAFLTTDERGKRLPEYLKEVALHLKNEQGELLAELGGLAHNVEHIKEIVAMQQSYAKVSGTEEKVEVQELVESALRMHSGAYARHSVKVVREYEPVPIIIVDRHKVLQILINLLHNAKYACDDGGAAEKKVVVRIDPHGRDRVTIEVEDNGIGIPSQNLTRIFSHGFTTRKNGHGFGLHSSALAAKELGGSLIATSEGTGKGATFTLDLPLSAAAKSAELPDRMTPSISV